SPAWFRNDLRSHSRGYIRRPVAGVAVNYDDFRYQIQRKIMENALNCQRFVVSRDDDRDSHVRSPFSPQQGRRPSLRQPCIDAPFSTGTTDSNTQRCKHWNEQLPYPRGTPLRHPQASQIEERHSCGWPGEKSDDQQNTKRNFGQCLHRCSHCSMASRQSHDRFPHSWRVSLLDVEINKAGVAFRTVQTFSHILEEY